MGSLAAEVVKDLADGKIDADERERIWRLLDAIADDVEQTRRHLRRRDR